MKQKINLHLALVSVFASALTMFCIILICYNLIQEQVRKDLKNTANLLAKTGISKLVNSDDGALESEQLYSDKEIRITWIAADGTVLYDNDAEANTMTNHSDRPEVSEAFQTGTGESVRESDTMNMKTYYHAILLEDGTVLRVATQARSLANVFVQAVPILFLMILMILIVCVLLSHVLTKQIMQPIKDMAENIDNHQEEPVYKELSPFMHRIREQHDNILSAARSRQDFTANVSHELKTPLTAISGYAELIENDMVDAEKQKKFAGDIKKNADRLVDLINDIIRLSELDSKEVSMDFMQQNLYEAAKDRVELLKTAAAGKEVSLSLEGEDAFLLSNRGLLVELLDNLIQNAVRYNYAGGKVLVKTGNENGHAFLCVSDTGIGIPESEQERIFERFYRVDKSRSRETGGTGLGLSIVKHIVELHDGKIELKSEVGKGTDIKITF